jgi:hypothetical protein
METLQEIILKSVVGRKINAHDETVIVTGKPVTPKSEALGI